jgi:hypothetical protein
VRILSHLAGHIVANLWVQAGHQHESVDNSNGQLCNGYFTVKRKTKEWDLRFLHDVGNLFFVGLQATDKVFLE